MPREQINYPNNTMPDTKPGDTAAPPQIQWAAPALITTTAELDSLPDGAWVIGCENAVIVLQKVRDKLWNAYSAPRASTGETPTPYTPDTIIQRFRMVWRLVTPQTSRCTDDPAISIGWRSDTAGNGHVQLEFNAEVAYFERVALWQESWSLNEGPPRTSVFSPVLDRAELNKMIRTLRRARNAAYGDDA